jgi:hypothetical protein
MDFGVGSWSQVCRTGGWICKSLFRSVVDESWLVWARSKSTELDRCITIRSGCGTESLACVTCAKPDGSE